MEHARVPRKAVITVKALPPQVRAGGARQRIDPNAANPKIGAFAFRRLLDEFMGGGWIRLLA
jgi:hypothetical protein